MTSSSNDADPHRSRRAARATMMFHPSLYVPNLDDAEAWIERFFGRRSIPLTANFADAPPRAGYPTDYSIFTPIAEVLFDTVDPSRYLVDGEQHAPSVAEPELRNFGWYVDDVVAAYRSMRGLGYRAVGQLGEEGTDEEPPGSAGTGRPMFFAVPEDAGLRYQFVSPELFAIDHRAPGWTLPPPSDDDPLAIVRCSRHTVLTTRRDRGVSILVEVIGGTIVHEGRNELLGTTSTYVHVGDGIIEYAVPDSGTALDDLVASADPCDAYYSLVFDVVDLERVEHHLEAVGVGIGRRSDDTILVDPATGLGVAWGFTTERVPGDPRL